MQTASTLLAFLLNSLADIGFFCTSQLKK